MKFRHVRLKSTLIVLAGSTHEIDEDGFVVGDLTERAQALCRSHPNYRVMDDEPEALPEPEAVPEPTPEPEAVPEPEALKKPRGRPAGSVNKKKKKPAGKAKKK